MIRVKTFTQTIEVFKTAKELEALDGMGTILSLITILRRSFLLVMLRPRMRGERL